MKQLCPTFIGERVSQKRQTKRINIKQMEEIEFSLHPICVVGEIKSGRAPIKSEHKNLEHSQTSHKQVKIHRK